MNRHPRRAVTAIELLIVLTIAMILMSMASIGLVRALRRAGVDESASAIVEAAMVARNLALRETAGADQMAFGVVVVDDPAGSPYVAVIRGGPRDGRRLDRERIWTGTDGKARHVATLRRTVQIRVGGKDLRDCPDHALAWYYRSGSGLPVRLDPGGFSASLVGVGLNAITLNKVWGQAEPACSGEVAMLAKGCAAEPGLVLRSVDGAARQAVYVFPTGIVFKQAF